MCFPALGTAGANCAGCGATARVEEGAQMAPLLNGLSATHKGGGAGGYWPRASFVGAKEVDKGGNRGPMLRAL